MERKARAIDLLERHLGMRRAVPCLDIGTWPTPAERLDRLGGRLGADLWVKRDDVAADTGGNKVRKLEFLLADAVAGGRRTLVTVGGTGSRHVVATAVLGRRLGLATRAAVFPQAGASGTLHLAALGVAVHRASSRATAPISIAAALAMADEPYLIGPGGSSPLGTLGYVAAALELREQIDSGVLPVPDTLFVALGSGGTLSGLALGLGLAGIGTRLVGVRVVEPIFMGARAVSLLGARTRLLLDSLGVDPAIRPSAVRVDIEGSQLGRGYGWSTSAAEEALRMARGDEGLELDTTYTAKAMAALLAHARGRGRGERILFWHTYDGGAVTRTRSS